MKQISASLVLVVVSVSELKSGSPFSCCFLIDAPSAVTLSSLVGLGASFYSRDTTC